MTDSAALPPHARAAVTHFAEGAVRLRERTRAARSALESPVGTATSADGSVTVRVDPNGALTDVRLTAGASEHGVDALAAVVLETTRLARVRALQQAEHDLTAVVGERSRAVAVLHRQLQSLVGVADPSAADEPDGDTGFTGRR